jgi:hypothetical protein
VPVARASSRSQAAATILRVTADTFPSELANLNDPAGEAGLAETALPEGETQESVMPTTAHVDGITSRIAAATAAPHADLRERLSGGSEKLAHALQELLDEIEDVGRKVANELSTADYGSWTAGMVALVFAGDIGRRRWRRNQRGFDLRSEGDDEATSASFPGLLYLINDVT